MEEYRIKQYFELDQKIKRLEILLEKTNKEMFQQTLATHLSYSDERGIHVKAPRIETIVIDNVMACELVEKRIERNRTRLKYFRTYLTTLSLNEQQALYNGYASDNLREQTYDEIHEIETAICLRERIKPPEERIKLCDDLFENIAAMAEAFI